MQNLSISKIDDDNRYCTVIFCFLKEYNICFCKHCAMISTDDTSKISLVNYTISATTRGKRVLVAYGQSLQLADNNFGKVSLTPTVVLFDDLPECVKQTFCWWTPHTYMKIHATEPSSAIKNAWKTAETS